MTYRITIDKALCSGFGSCVQLAPEVFELRGGTAVARLPASRDPAVLEAADQCPMGAIAVELEEAA
jgi:ferredoxin